MNTNVRAVYHLTMLAVPHLEKTKVDSFFAVLWIQDVYPGSEIFPFRIQIFKSRIPDPNFVHSGSASKNLSILTQKNGF